MELQPDFKDFTLNKSSDNWSEYSTLPAPTIQLRRYDDGRGSRFYWYYDLNENNEIQIHTGIGITSLLAMVMPESKPLTDWKLKNDNHKELLADSSEYGTILHIIYSKWLIEKKVEKALLDAARIPVLRAGMNYDMPERDLCAFMLWCEEYSVEPILIEALLISDPINGEHYMQTVDLLCKLTVQETYIESIQDGVWQRGELKGQPKMVEKKVKVPVVKVANVDFKSNFMSKDAKSFFDAHKFQLIGAARAVAYNYPEINVDMLVNWSPDNWRTNPSYTMKVWDITKQDNALFDKYVEIAYIRGLFKPSGNKYVFPEFNPETKSDHFKRMNYEEFIKHTYFEPTANEILARGVDSGDSEVVEHTTGEQEES